jgi:type II secretory pathway pseudopilin PulG
MERNNRTRGFTLVEIAVGIALIGLILLAFAGMTTVVQKSAGRTRQYTDAQQNARAALDYITEQLRAAGADIAAYEGQTTIVHAGPYQVGFNADLDQGQTLNGETPMASLNTDMSPNTVPDGGTVFYTPAKTFASGAETVVLTLDSDGSGVVDDGDRGDEVVENGRNDHVYVLKQYRYGYVAGAANEKRAADVAMLRGPVAYENGDNPPPLFEYYYNHDGDVTTADRLWGDTDNNGKISSGEAGNLTAVPDSLLHAVRMVKINVVAEGNQVAGANVGDDGFVNVVMSSRVWIRNVDIRESSRVYGVVYLDADGNGQRDAGEPGIPQVKLTIESTGRKTTTDGYGYYNIPVSGGSYSLVESDPAGFTSTTPNKVAFTVAPGEKHSINFGDGNGLKFGYVVGTVWDDKDLDTVKDGDEEGIPGVMVQVDGKYSGKSNDAGYYRITVPVGSHTVKEFDLVGYTSTTPNAVGANLANQGDSVVVNFGDAIGQNTGTLAGHVYLDDDEDGVRDFAEQGLSGVSISLSNGSSMTTDAEGYYEFSLDPGKYDVYQLDLDGYTSTTPNLVSGVVIATDTTVTLDFGDILLKDLEFVEILVSDTDRPLSLSVADMREDTKLDTDIVLGTPSTGGPGNLFFYINDYNDGSTPVSDLFDSNPTFTRKASTDVNAVEALELSGDKIADVVTGQEAYNGGNLLEWYNNGNGKVGNSPDGVVTSGSSSATTRLRINDVNGDGIRDLLVGHRSKLSPFTGGFEVLGRSMDGGFSSLQVVTTNGKDTPLGVVTAMATGDLDRDGDPDLVLGSNQGDYWGHIDFFYNEGNGTYTWKKRVLAKASVNDVAVVELYNDGTLYPDVLVGISDASNVGGVQVWLNQDGVFGQPDNTGFVFDDDTDPRMPDAYYDAGGEVLAIAAVRLDADIYPEVVIGTRSSLFYTGDLLVVQGAGSGDQKTTNIKVNIAGEVVTIDFADFNKDSNLDIVVTTRTSASAGKLAIYFLDDPSVIP